MEYGTIEREIEINASPATVFEVITSPEHLTEWWPDEAVLEPTPGAVGELVFGDRSSGEAEIPPHRRQDVVHTRRLHRPHHHRRPIGLVDRRHPRRPGLGGKIQFRFPQGGFDMEVNAPTGAQLP